MRQVFQLWLFMHSTCIMFDLIRQINTLIHAKTNPYLITVSLILPSLLLRVALPSWLQWDQTLIDFHESFCSVWIRKHLTAQRICKSLWGSSHRAPLMRRVVQAVCTNAVANENCDLTESFKNSMIAENDGLYPREFYGLKVSFIIAESSRSWV